MLTYHQIHPEQSFKNEQHLKAITQIHSLCKSSDILIIAGDFNIHDASWVLESEESNVMLLQSIQPKHAEIFVENIHRLGLYQVNRVSNENNRHLDLVFTSDPMNLEVSTPSPICSTDVHNHISILISFQWHPSDNPSDHIASVLNFNKGDYAGFNQCLQDSGLLENTTLRQHINKTNSSSGSSWIVCRVFQFNLQNKWKHTSFVVTPTGFEWNILIWLIFRVWSAHEDRDNQPRGRVLFRMVFIHCYSKIELSNLADPSQSSSMNL